MRGKAAAGADAASCSCGFRRFHGVDNAAASMAKPAYGYANGVVPTAALEAIAKRRAARDGAGSSPAPTLSDCEAACCEEALCHSVTWRANTSTCVAALSIAHGARAEDWCWHPTVASHAVTSIRLPGEWEARAVSEARRFFAASKLTRSAGAAKGPRAFSKTFSNPVGHSHPMERAMQPESCEATGRWSKGRMFGGEMAISDVTAAAVSLSTQRSDCPSQLHPKVVRTTKQGQNIYGGV